MAQAHASRSRTSVAKSCRHQRNFSPILTVRRNLVMLHELEHRITVLDPGKRLHDLHDGVAHLRQGQLLARADPRSSAEGEIAPEPRPQLLPPLRAERVRVVSEQISAPVQRIEAKGDDVAFPHVYRGGPAAGWAAAGGEDRIAKRHARVRADGRVQPEGLVDRVLEILEAFQPLERQMRSVSRLQDLLAKLPVDAGIACEIEEHVRQANAGGVVCRKEHVQQLVAHVVPVSGPLDQLVGDDIPLPAGWRRVVAVAGQHSLGDVSLDELARRLARVPEALVPGQEVPLR